MSDVPRVRQLRLVVTASDYVRFYRDVLGMPERADWSSPDGRVILLAAGEATIELIDERQAAYIDEVEVGHRVAGHVRVALEVDDAAGATRQLADAGAEVVASPRRTPWNSLNARLAGAADLHLTLYTELD